MQETLLEKKYGSIHLPDVGSDPELMKHVSYIRFLIEPYKGELKAPFLLSEFTEFLWQTTNGKKTRRNSKGRWVGTENINWSILLPDDSLLTDNENSVLLDTCRKVYFFYRLGLADGNPPAITTARLFNGHILRLARWVNLNKNKYQPEKYGFSLIDQSGIDRLFREIAEGGWSLALRTVERAFNAMYINAFNQAVPPSLMNSMFNLPEDVKLRIREWLTEGDAYVSLKNPNGSEVQALSGNRLEFLLSIDKGMSAASPRFRVFLRQFEPDLFHKDLLLSRQDSASRNYPSHRTPFIKDVMKERCSENSYSSIGRVIGNSLKLHRHIPCVLPEPSTLNITRAMACNKSLLATAGHTPFIPIDTGLKYLNEALRWTVRYGDELIDYYIAILSKLKVYSDQSGAKNGLQNAIAQRVHQYISEIDQPENMKKDGFIFYKWGESGSSHSPRERHGKYNLSKTYPEPIDDVGMSISRAIWIFTGACLVVIGMVKPSRSSELFSLPFDCLLDNGKGSYWLDSDLAKRTAGEYKATTEGRPIPVIAAKVIKKMQRLSAALKDVYEEKDSYKKSLLFYFPQSSNSDSDYHELYLKIDRFYDQVNLPLDDYGRRWYARIHEMRKWFLLLLFWSGRYDVLDAARWVAGHTNVEHIYAYIEREFPAEQLGELEAEYTIELLENNSNDGPDKGLKELRQLILKHFKVTSLRFVEDRKWKGYIKTLFTDQYHLEPYTIKTDKNDKVLEVAIRSGKRPDHNE